MQPLGRQFSLWKVYCIWMTHFKKDHQLFQGNKKPLDTDICNFMHSFSSFQNCVQKLSFLYSSCELKIIHEWGWFSINRAFLFLHIFNSKLGVVHKLHYQFRVIPKWIFLFITKKIVLFKNKYNNIFIFSCWKGNFKKKKFMDYMIIISIYIWFLS